MSLPLTTCRSAQGRKQELPAIPVSGQLTSPEVPSTRRTTLDLTFAGDIMAHTVNFTMANYDRIYDDVRPFLLSDDLTFGNFEAPVNDTLPMTPYPRFNIHSSYLTAAIAGGFDVFSLANNHANDQGTEGIRGTIAATNRIGTATGTDQACTPVYFSGLRQKETDAMHPVLIRKNGWTILFLAVTEILNSYDSAGKLVYYVAPTEKGRTQFLADVARMRKENFCDAFIVSLHSNEMEYVHTAGESKKQWFARLARAGVDIVWAHHPHVMQEWATAKATGQATEERTVLFMYSMGNFVSGQRFVPDTENPAAPREYTGDAVLLRVRLTRSTSAAVSSDAAGYGELTVRPVVITNWNDPRGGVVVRRFTEDFVKSLPATWQTYYRARYSLLRVCLPLLPARPVTGILEE